MNMLCLISYDLESATGEEYTALRDYLKSIGTGGWDAPLKSTFMVITTKSKDEIHDGIKKVLTNKEGTLRAGTKWMITPIRLADSTGFLSISTVEWWGKASELGF
ncbi:hypothetical protein ACFFLM_08945 [Deinococcus oregonensis]|uniref:CRISPR-associated protein Cas2 n=1 Tax=Deinococcus oregonensis TaxID=1805970 RepID=A0ABV6AX69_9DEIO